MKTTIEMAREAAGDDWGLFQEYMPEIHKLVELVRADERARMAEQPAQQALDKMAENARELGLDYEPAQQEPVPCCGKYETCTQACTPRGRFLGKREALAEQPAQLPFGVGGGLVAIKTLLSRDPCVHANTAIQMIDAILAEQPAQQEPVAWYRDENGIRIYYESKVWDDATPLYTSPQPAQRTWVGLTDEDLANCSGHEVRWALYWEKLLKDKNNV